MVRSGVVKVADVTGLRPSTEAIERLAEEGLVAAAPPTRSSIAAVDTGRVARHSAGRRQASSSGARRGDRGCRSAASWCGCRSCVANRSPARRRPSRRRPHARGPPAAVYALRTRLPARRAPGPIGWRLRRSLPAGLALRRPRRLSGARPRHARFHRPRLRAGRAFLESRGFRLGNVKVEPYEGVPGGIVLRQFPLPGHPLRGHDAVSLVVSASAGLG